MTRLVFRIPALILLAVFLCTLGWDASAQGRPPLKDYIAPDELITISSQTPFNTALDIFKSAFRRFENKVLVVEQASNDPINVNVTQMYWKDAFEYVLRINFYWYQETPDYVRVFPVPQAGAARTDTLTASGAIETREVEISAIFFEVDRTKAEQLGIDWSLTGHSSSTNLQTGAVNWGAKEFVETTENSSSGSSSEQSVEYGGKTILQSYGSTLDILAVLQAIESNNLGELISRPSITVRSEETGRIQVGADISIAQKDFSGNTVEKFFSTGTIISVTPKVMKVDSIEFVHLLIAAERSSYVPDATRTIINKTLAETSVILLNEEETVVGGLFSNENSLVRRGVPWLRDLPWWVLGLKYIFGYDETTVTQKELIIILKAKILPSLENRLEMKLNEIKKGQRTLQNETERIRALRRDLLQQIENAKKSDPEE